jgi:hypothetical protein
MAFRLPNGSTVDIASTYGTAKTVTAISNANPAVVSSTAHGFSNGDYVELTSGWLKLNGRVFRVISSTTDAFSLEGANTTSTTDYPVGSSAGSVRKITAFVGVSQITDVATTGGDQQFLTFGFLEENDDRQLPTTRSPQTITFTVADDPTQAYVPIAEGYDNTRSIAAVRLNLPDGSKIVYNGYLSFSETPTLARNNLMVRTMTFSLSGRPVRYNV